MVEIMEWQEILIWSLDSEGEPGAMIDSQGQEGATTHYECQSCEHRVEEEVEEEVGEYPTTWIILDEVKPN
jgi:hypothetical protein